MLHKLILLNEWVIGVGPKLLRMWSNQH